MGDGDRQEAGGWWDPGSLHSPQDGAGRPEKQHLWHGPCGVAAPLELTRERARTSEGVSQRPLGKATAAPERPNSTALQQRHSVSHCPGLAGQGQLSFFEA